MLSTAIILAGGYGTRLQSVVSDLPKPMAPVNGQPFLDYQLQYLKSYGFKNVVLSVGYLSEKISEHYGASFKGMQLFYAKEEDPLGTGGGIRMALEHCFDDEIFVLNGDSFFDVDPILFFKKHCEKVAQFSLALRKVDDTSRYGAIEKNTDNRVTSFHEKNGLSVPGTINGGVYILNKNIFFENTVENINFSIEKDFFEKRLSDLAIYGFEFDGYFLDIGIPEDYNKAQDDFKGFKYR